MSLSTLRKMTDEMDALSVEPTMIQGTKISWPGGPAMAQNFSLPLSIIYYIAMNPSTPKVYNKLIRTCKYFFQRNPILVAATITEKAICLNDKWNGHGRCCVKMDFKKIKSKIWPTHCLILNQNTIPNLVRHKIYRCNIVNFFINEGTVEFEDFKFFALSAKKISFCGTKIVFDNGTPVMLENILKELPNVEDFTCWLKDNDSMISASTIKNISKIVNLGNLEKMVLYNVPEDFKLDDLFSFIKDRNGIKFWLIFADNISHHFKNELAQLADSLIESHVSNCYISYRGQNQEKRRILSKRYYK